MPYIIKTIKIFLLLSPFSSFIYASEPNTYITTDGLGETYISDSSFTNTKVTYAIKDNWAIFEGDIILGTIDEVESWREIQEESQNNTNQRSLIITGDRYRWNQGILVYQIASNVSSSTRTLITQALAHWELKTFVRFIERTSSNASFYSDYVEVISNDYACWSYVGRQGGRQYLNVVSGCGFGATVHEFGHALGLWHEQSREDRNSFVRIHWDNIASNQQHNFNQHIFDGDDIASYDYGSIMHYGSRDFSINGQETISSLSTGVTLGQREGLSIGDIASINIMYAPIADDNYEENDNLNTAYNLENYEGINLSTVAGSAVQVDEDWYKIYLRPSYERVQISLNFTHADGDIDVELFNASGIRLSVSQGASNSEFIDYTVEESGYYYIKVHYGNRGNAYELKWEESLGNLADYDGDGIPDYLDSDDDNDGIPDTIEISYGLNPLDASDGQGDLDNDGFSNYLEFTLGTDMDNAQSKPRWIHIFVDDIVLLVPVKI